MLSNSPVLGDKCGTIPCDVRESSSSTPAKCPCVISLAEEWRPIKDTAVWLRRFSWLCSIDAGGGWGNAWDGGWVYSGRHLLVTLPLWKALVGVCCAGYMLFGCWEIAIDLQVSFRGLCSNRYWFFLILKAVSLTISIGVRCFSRRTGRLNSSNSENTATWRRGCELLTYYLWPNVSFKLNCVNCNIRRTLCFGDKLVLIPQTDLQSASTANQLLYSCNLQ